MASTEGERSIHRGLLGEATSTAGRSAGVRRYVAQQVALLPRGAGDGATHSVGLCALSVGVPGMHAVGPTGGKGAAGTGSNGGLAAVRDGQKRAAAHIGGRRQGRPSGAVATEAVRHVRRSVVGSPHGGGGGEVGRRRVSAALARIRNKVWVGAAGGWPGMPRPSASLPAAAARPVGGLAVRTRLYRGPGALGLGAAGGNWDSATSPTPRWPSTLSPGATGRLHPRPSSDAAEGGRACYRRRSICCRPCSLAVPYCKETSGACMPLYCPWGAFAVWGVHSGRCLRGGPTCGITCSRSSNTAWRCGHASC